MIKKHLQNRRKDHYFMMFLLALLILPDYPSVLGVDEDQAALLMGILGVAIGLGSVAAGLVSGHHIEPRLIPIGAGGMTAMFLALGIAPAHYGTVAILLFGAGVFAGFYIVPLQALLQHLSPAGERGRMLGTANAMSFVASTLGGVIFLVASTLNMPANRVFLICAALAFVGTGVLIWSMRRMLNDPEMRKVAPPKR